MALLTGPTAWSCHGSVPDSFPDRHAQCRGFWSTLLWRVSPNGRSSTQVHRFIHFWGGAGRGGKNAGTRMCRAVACLRCRVFLKMGVSFLRGCGLTALADGYYVSAGWRRKYSRGKMGVPSGKEERRILSCSTLLVVRKILEGRRRTQKQGRYIHRTGQGQGQRTEGMQRAGRPAGDGQTDKNANLYRV